MDARQPLASLPAVLEAALAAGPDSLGEGATVTLAPLLRAALQTPGALESLPLLGASRVDEVPIGSLVRFQGMIQDVRDPEYYAGLYHERIPGADARIRTGKYRDVLDVADGSEITDVAGGTWQRLPVVCVPIPSQTRWAAAVAAPPAVPAPEAPEKQTGAAPPAAKPQHARDEPEPMDDGDDDGGETGARKRTRTREEGGGATGGCVPCGSLPWAPSGPAGSCVVKVYGAADGDDAADASKELSELLRVGALIEVVGVLELDAAEPAAEAQGLQSAMQQAFAEERALLPLPSAQPRLHAICFRRLGASHHPLLPAPSSAEEGLALQAARAHAASLRPAIVAALASALGGDELAAELALFAAVSRVSARSGEAPIGKFALNVSGCPAGGAGGAGSAIFAPLRSVFEQLLPYCAAMPLGIEWLNAAALVPKKDHDANCLVPGDLQLPPGAMLLLDETAMSAGALNEAGVKNVKALSQLLELQKLAYDFTFCTVDFSMDVSVLSLSTSKSVLPFGCQCPLRVVPNAPPPPAHLNNDGWLGAARGYLGLVSRVQESLAMSEESTQVLREDFVSSRKLNPSVTADDFSRWLTCTRLHAASLLAPEVHQEHYMHVKQLEADRCVRLGDAARAGKLI